MNGRSLVAFFRHSLGRSLFKLNIENPFLDWLNLTKMENKQKRLHGKTIFAKKIENCNHSIFKISQLLLHISFWLVNLSHP